ncbi:hypothetical protein SNE40_012432 [Patella caerulea]|uniref:Uncharacterized protein n=1 Tax=Patella caerulea TaxID=87958 RepID=A0AAN8JRL1_PATCE
MDGWERPAVESAVPHTFSAPMDLENLPLGKQEVQVFEFHARFTIDPTQQYEISSVDFVADTDLMNIYVKVEHGGTQLYLQANSCGKGICLLHQEDSRVHRIVLIQDISIANMVRGNHYPIGLKRIFMQDSLHDIISVELNYPSRREEDRGYVYNTVSPSFTLNYDHEDIQYDPGQAENVNLVTHISSQTANLNDSQMTVYALGMGGADVPSLKGKMEIKNDSFVNYKALLDLANPNFNDSVLLSSILLNTRGHPRNLSVYIDVYRIYRIFPNTQWSPKPIRELNLGCNLHNNEGDYAIGDVAQIQCWVHSPWLAPIRWYKKVNGVDKPLVGFDVGVYPVLYATETTITSYDISRLDAGDYVAKVSLPVLGLYSSYSFRINIFEEHIRVQMSHQRENGQVVVTCSSTGRPRPSLSFYIVPDDVGETKIAVINNDIFTVRETNTAGNLTTRELVIKEPRTFDHPETYFYISCAATNQYETSEYTAYFVDFSM